MLYLMKKILSEDEVIDPPQRSEVSATGNGAC